MRKSSASTVKSLAGYEIGNVNSHQLNKKRKHILGQVSMCLWLYCQYLIEVYCGFWSNRICCEMESTEFNSMLSNSFSTTPPPPKKKRQENQSTKAICAIVSVISLACRNHLAKVRFSLQFTLILARKNKNDFIKAKKKRENSNAVYEILNARWAILSHRME